MALTQVRYNRTYHDPAGRILTLGNPTFTLSQVIANGTTTVMPEPIVCTVNGSGQLVGPDGVVGVLLDVLDDAATSPQGTHYAVSGEAFGVPWNLAASTVDGPVCDLATKAPALAGSPSFQYATQGQLAAYVPMPFTPEQHGAGSSYNAGVDETAAVLATLNAASAAGGGVVWLSRRYQITSIQATVANVTVYAPHRSMGLVSSLAKSTSSPVLQLIGAGNHVKNITVTYNTTTNIDTDGTTLAANTDSASSIIVGAAIGASSGSFVADVSVEDCIVQYSRNTSVLVTGVAARGKVLNNYCTEQAQGIAMIDCASAFEVAGNTVSRSIDDLIAVLGDSFETAQTNLRGRVHHNDLSKGYANGIDLSGADHVIVDHNTIDTTWNPGILVWQYAGTGPTGPDYRVIVEGNTVRNAGTYFGAGQYKTATGSSGNGIQVTAQANTTVTANNVYLSAGNGIQADAVTGLLVTANQVLGSTGIGVQVTASTAASKDVVIADNVVQLNNGGIYAQGNATFGIAGITIHDNQIRSYKNGGAGAYRGIQYQYLSNADIHDNTIVNDTAGDVAVLENTSNSCTAASTRVATNPGYNPIVSPASQPSAPVNATPVTNPFYVDATVYLTGGSGITGIFVKGPATGAGFTSVGSTTPAVVRVPAMAIIQINTNTTMPSWTWLLD